MKKILLTPILLLLYVTSMLAVDNRELKIGMTQEFENPNPIIKQMLATSYMYGFVGRALVVLDPDGVMVEKLAVKIPTLENGLAEFFDEDGKRKLRATWEVREGAVWGDGAPVTGHDFKLSWTIGLSDTVSVGDTEMYTQISRIEIDPDNPKKFTLVYDDPKFNFNQIFQIYFVPSHLEGPVFEKHGGENQGYEKNTNYIKDPTNPGLYNGPYRVSEMKLGSHVILVPNENWHGKKPAIQKVILKFIPNTATLEANLKSGTIDMVSILGFRLDQALAFEKRIEENELPFKMNYKSGLTYEHVDLQVGKNEFLKDINVRKALVHAIDRDLLSNTLFDGKQKKAIHNIAPIDPWYTDEPEKIVLYRHSKRTARKLLDKAGWLVGDDGYRYRNGEKLTFQIMTTAQDKTRENVEVFLQSEWKSVGVELTMKNEAPRVFFGETVRKGKYPGMAMYAWYSYPEHPPRLLHSSAIPSEENGHSGQNSMGWINEEVDTLIEQVELEFDFEKRKKLAQKILYHYTNEVPVIPLYYRSEVAVTPANMENYVQTGHLISPTCWAENWRLVD